MDASANCALNEAKFFNDPSSGATMLLPDDLAVYYPHDRCGDADPLLMMQVTVFSCGGFVAGVIWNHAIADGAGMAQFLQAVGELTSGLPAPSVVPTQLAAGPPSGDHLRVAVHDGPGAVGLRLLGVHHAFELDQWASKPSSMMIIMVVSRAPCSKR